MKSTCRQCQGTKVVIKNPCMECHGKGSTVQRTKVTVPVPAGITLIIIIFLIQICKIKLFILFCNVFLLLKNIKILAYNFCLTKSTKPKIIY